jgi:hypothetical protein
MTRRAAIAAVRAQSGKLRARKRAGDKSARIARELNVADAAGMLIMLRRDYQLALRKLDNALSLLIGMKAVRELQQQDAEAAS